MFLEIYFGMRGMFNSDIKTCNRNERKVWKYGNSLEGLSQPGVF
jgi:hypothetical protein